MDIEQRARDALNEVRRERHLMPWGGFDTREENSSIEAVCRLIEQHDAKMREVSDACTDVVMLRGTVIEVKAATNRILSRFILPEPVDVLLFEAREIAAKVLTDMGASDEQIAAGDIATGKRDDAIIVHATLAALRRGMDLATVDGAGAL